MASIFSLALNTFSRTLVADALVKGFWDFLVPLVAVTTTSSKMTEKSVAFGTSLRVSSAMAVWVMCSKHKDSMLSFSTFLA